MHHKYHQQSMPETGEGAFMKKRLQRGASSKHRTRHIKSAARAQRVTIKQKMFHSTTSFRQSSDNRNSAAVPYRTSNYAREHSGKAFTISNQKNLHRTIDPIAEKGDGKALQDYREEDQEESPGPEKRFNPSQFLNEDFLAILNEHRKTCEREGKLDQATQARKRLKELRIFEEEKRKQEVFTKHVSKIHSYDIKFRDKKSLPSKMLIKMSLKSSLINGIM